MNHRSTKGSSRLPFVVFTIVGVALAGAGCADVNGDALQQDVAQLRQDVNALKVQVHRGRGESDALGQLDRRVRDQSAENTRQLTALSGRVEGVSAELGRLSTRLDDVSRRLEALNRRSSSTDSTSPPPVAQPAPPAPRGPAAAPAPPPAPIVTAPVPAVPPSPGSNVPPSVAAPPPAAPEQVTRAAPTAPTRPSTGGATAEEAYQAAYLDFSRGRYPLAISGFREFLRRYPDSPLADSAQYGIGESYYSQATAAAAEGQAEKATRALEQAVQEFRKVIVTYPRGAKVPTALYKEALALAELKQTALAQARLQYLLDHFPQSEEAPLAKERLAALRQ